MHPALLLEMRQVWVLPHQLLLALLLDWPRPKAAARPQIEGVEPMTLPGFTAESALYRPTRQYRSAAPSGDGGAPPRIAAQLLLARPGGPFSGSCGCGPGYCCCILCYVDNCYFWCWSTARVGL
jgi:hypothetical protein